MTVRVRAATQAARRALRAAAAPAVVATVAAAALAAAAAPARAEDPGYEVVLTVVRTADPPTVSLSILPHAGHHLFADGPLLVRLHGDGVTLPRALLRREDAVDPRAEAPRFELPFHRDRAGARLDADLTFYICRGQRCRPVERSYGTSL